MGLTTTNVSILLTLMLASVSLADVFSCGGFVKSRSSIDYSKITVKLLTPEGHLKHEEEVNPSNGYFMIPIYNKGQYSLKVSSPAGYHFAPEVFQFKLDGKTDPCSKNEDIIFELDGFAIRGVVDGAGPGLNLELSQNGKVIDSTVTTDGGKYEMKAPSGQYEVSTARGTSECISRGKASVKVLEGPVDVTPNLKISGYQLNVEVKTSNNKPFANANVALFANQEIDLPTVKCEKSSSSNVPTTHPYKCDIGKSDANGKLSVACVPAGEYYVSSQYGAESNRIGFSPNVGKVQVSQKASRVEFVAETIESKVRVVAQNTPLSGVDVTVNGKKVGVTDKLGFVGLKGLKENDNIVISASANNVHFSEVKTTVKFPTLNIDDVKVSKFDICGKVEKSESGTIESLKLTKKSEQKSIEIRPKADGSFCQSVSPGIYNIEASDKSSSLTPRLLEVDASEKPITDLRFTHFKTDAHVRVSCIGACPTSSVSLYLHGNTLIKTVKGNDVFVFENIGPGNYKARLDDGGRGCWEQEEIILTVEQSKSQPTVHFVQNGFAAKMRLSHPATIKWENVDKKQLRGETTSQGQETVSMCVPTSGVYTVSFESCYKFEHQRFEMSVPYDGVRNEKATAARISGVVDMEGEKDASVTVKVKSSIGEREVAVSDGGRFSFDEPLSSHGDVLHFVPTSTVRLFEPTSANAKFDGKCNEKAVSFKSFRGIFIDGNVRPVVAGVQINAVLKADKSVVIKTTSDKSGNYKIGPIKRVEDYEITASLDGFKFLPADQKGNFQSVKLSQLSIKVIDEQTSAPLDGVLLSLVGGKGAGSDYRSNSVLDATAHKNFIALAPGEYYVRPILQEYKFTPSTTSIQVKEGIHENLVLKGKRVSFSVFGKIREMSGAAVSDVVVEALSAQCDQHQSETTTEANGSFRLRGLLPDCKYKIYAKAYADGSPAPHSFPGQFTVDMTAEDVKGLEFIAMPVAMTTDAAVEIDMSQVKDIQSVRVTVTRGNTQVQSQSVQYPQNLFYLSHLDRDGSEYSVRVEPEKPQNAFTAKTAFFTADAPIRIVRLPLSATKKANDVDISLGSILSFPFFVCLALAFFNQSKVVGILASLYTFITAPNPVIDTHRKRK